MSLKEAAASGVRWSSVSKIGRQILQFITTIILARLLSPFDFGLMGMALVITGFLDLLKDLGTTSAVIRQKNPSEEFLSSVYWMNISIGLVFTIVLYLSSVWVGALYHEGKVIPVLRFISFAFLISSIGSLHQTLLEKDLCFKKLAQLEIFSMLVASLVGIIFALNGYGVMSLAYQSLTGSIVMTLLLWCTSQWRPKWIFHWRQIKSVGRYSANLTGFNVFNYFARNADNLLIGCFLGAQALGWYQLAYRIMFYPLQSVSDVVGRVIFPLYSHVQDDPIAFRRVYLKVVGTIAFVTFPLMTGIMAVSKTFIMTVFGVQWTIVASLIMILAPIGMVQSVGTTVGAIYLAKGRTDWMFRWGVGVGILVIISFVIGLHWGVVGVAAAYAIISLAVAYPNLAIPFSLIELKFTDFIKALSKPFVLSLSMVLVVQSVKMLLPQDLTSACVLIILVSVGVLVYVMGSWMVNRGHVHDLLSLANIHAFETSEKKT